MNKSDISIHAPKRERRPASPAFTSSTLFQSTLPNGSDRNIRRLQQHVLHFNPRSQTGATYDYNTSGTIQLISIHAPKRERPRLHDYPVLGRGISIHAPKRERRQLCILIANYRKFQSTLPNGSDIICLINNHGQQISIHAPKRERPLFPRKTTLTSKFQSTLPNGSDGKTAAGIGIRSDISIHAPKRERRGSGPPVE